MEKTFEGVWYLPGKRENKLNGTLRYSYESRIELKVIGSFEGRPTTDIPTYEMVNGLTVNGKKITLLRCHTTNHSIHAPGTEEFTFLVEQLVIGDFFERIPGQEFTALRFHLYKIEDWLDLRLIKVVNEYDAKRVTYTFEWPQPIVIPLDDGSELSIIHLGTSELSGATNKVRLKYKAYFELKSRDPFAFEEIHGLIYRIRMLISFFTLRPYFADEVQVRSLVDERTKDGKVYPRWIDFYFNQFADFSTDYGDEGKYSFLKYAVPFPAIKEVFGTLLRGWFEKYDLLSPIIQSYYLYFYLAETTVEAKFLHVVQAFEAFHRRTSKNSKMTVEEFHEKLSAVTEGINPELVSWVKEKLAFAYEPSLKERICELLRDSNALGFGQTFGNIDEFARQVRDSRNYLTHFDERLRRKLMKPSEMISATEHIAEYLLFLIIREIGMGNAMIKDLVEKARSVSLLRR